MNDWPFLLKEAEKKRGQLEDAMFLYVFPIPFGFFTPQEFHTIPIARKS